MQYKHLAREERLLIQELRQDGYSCHQIAFKLDRDHTTISRELKRNSTKGGYQYKQADEFARRRRSEASSVPRKMTEQLWAMIDDILVNKRWSPEQIAGRLRLEGVLSVSAKWIYEHIWADRAEGGILFRYLRRRGKKPNRRGRDGAGRGVIPGRVDISERPKEVERKERVGDWEVDTITGSRHRGALVSVVDRASKFTFLSKVGAKTAQEVGDALVRCLGPVRELVFTITADNGKEFAGHGKVSAELCAGFYFAAPYHSWERGLNEHTNGLVREFIPKSQDLRDIDPVKVGMVQDMLNTRPRKALGYRTPAEVLCEALEALGGKSSTVAPALCRWRE